MLYIPIYVKAKHKGVFTKEFIPKGKIIWDLDNDCDLIVSYEKLLGLTDIFGKNFYKKFIKLAYFDKEYNRYILHTNGLQYINNSNNPNIGYPIYDNFFDNTKLIALRDINNDEELSKKI